MERLTLSILLRTDVDLRDRPWLVLRPGDPTKPPIQGWPVENEDQVKKAVDAFLQHRSSESIDDLCDRLMHCTHPNVKRHSGSIKPSKTTKQ